MVRIAFPPGLERAPSIDVAQAHQMIRSGAVCLVTSDVFDTLVWRPVAAPDHLFRSIGEHLIAAGAMASHLSVADIADARRVNEIRARDRAIEVHQTAECTLEEIWDWIPADLWAADHSAADGVAAELAVERAALRQCPSGARLLDDARRCGVRVELVSDIYLSATQLRDLLTAVGFDLTDVGVHTSADARTNKWDGLLAEVVSECGIETDRWLHVGDNPLSDIYVAHRDGGQACLVDIDRDDVAVDNADRPWRLLSSAIGTDGGRDAVVRETLVAAGGDGADPSYQFGSAVAGPIMAGFAGWASLTAERLGASHLHCLLREGGRIAELIDALRPTGPQRQVVHASRWAMMRAAVFEGNQAEIKQALQRRGPLTVGVIEQAFGIVAADAVRVLGRRTIPPADIANAAAALADDEITRSQIVKSCAALRARVATYLERTLHLDDGPLVLCDIGWGGSIQVSLTEILRSMGFGGEVIGLYLMQSPIASQRRADGARILSYLPERGQDGRAAPFAEILIRQPEFLERINTPPVGTLIDFADDGSPVTLPDDHDVINASLALAQRGVGDFCRTLATMALTDTDVESFWFEDQRCATAALESFSSVIRSPSPPLAIELSAWEHDDVAGDSAESLVSAEFVRWAPYLSAYDVGQVSMTEVFWVNGSPNRTLAVDLELIRDGYDLDAISPRSNTGLARIAVFAPGSEDAIAQVETVPRQARNGWLTLSLENGRSKIRAIRFDTGAADHLVEFADARIKIDAANSSVLIDGADALIDAANWIGGYALGGRLAVVAAGGYLVVPFDHETLGDVDSIWIRIAFRTTPIDEAVLRSMMPRWKIAAAKGRRGIRRYATRVSNTLKSTRQKRLQG